MGVPTPRAQGDSQGPSKRSNSSLRLRKSAGRNFLNHIGSGTPGRARPPLARAAGGVTARALGRFRLRNALFKHVFLEHYCNFHISICTIGETSLDWVPKRKPGEESICVRNFPFARSARNNFTFTSLHFLARSARNVFILTSFTLEKIHLFSRKARETFSFVPLFP